MDATLLDNPVSPELLSRLGRIVILWSSAESWIAMLLGTLIGADLGGANIVTNSLAVATQIKCVRGLLSVHASREPATKEVIDLLNRADAMRAERNEIMHGLWNAKGCEPGTALINTVNLDRAEIIRDRLVTVTDLDDLIGEIEQWIKDYAVLGAKIGFPRNKNATQSLFTEQP